MSTDYITARDEMFGIAETVFDDSATSTLIGYKPDVRWPADPKPSVPDVTKVWARVSHQVVTDGQAALANAQGQKLYEAKGLLFIQFFSPRNVGGMYDKVLQLALVMQEAYRDPSPTGEIWFRNAKVVQLPEEATSYPINFSTEFSYKTLQP